MPRANWVNPSFYRVAERLRDECLIGDGSLFTPGAAVWTGEAAREWDASISVADHSDRNFGEKLRDQLSGLSSAAVQFAAECLYVALLAEADTGDTKKLEHVDNALSMLPSPPALDDELLDAMRTGIATYGQGGRNRRDAHLRYLASLVAELKQRAESERRSLLSDPHAFRAFAYSVPERAGQMQREALLHLLFPEYFESTVSLTAKEKIVKAFSEYDTAPAEHLDARIASIREGLAAEYPDGFSFWDDELRAVWSEAGKAAPEVRAWLVRGANAFDENMLPRWFADGFISIGWPGAVSPPDPVVMDGVASGRFPVGPGDSTITFRPLPPPARIAGPATGNADFHALNEDGVTYCSIGYSGETIRADGWQDERAGDVVTCPWCELRLIGSGLLRASKAQTDVGRSVGAAFEERPAEPPFAVDASPEDIAARFRSDDPDAPEGRIRMGVGVQQRFLAMRPGDLVVTPDGDKVYVGRVTSEVYWVQEQLTAERRKVEWLNTESPASRAAIKEARPSLHRRLKTLLTVTDLKEDAVYVAELVGGASAWDEFVDWAAKLYAVPGFDGFERDYKLEIAERVAAARSALDSSDWYEQLKAAFGGKNNLTSFHEHGPFLRWAEENGESAQRFLRELWDGDSDAVLRGSLFEIPREAVPGRAARASLASFLLMGVDVHANPFFRNTVYERGSGLAGRETVARDANADALYEDFKLFVDELSDALAARGTPIRDRLDGQSLLWWLVQGPPPDEWSDDEQAAFFAWREGLDTNGPDPDPVGAVIAPVPQALADEVLIERDWIQNVVHLLNEKRQVVFYGPPGTGKTFIARQIAEHAVAAGGAWELVQFHPAYAYEDFVEGYRPTGSGTVEFTVRWGILRRLAEAARLAPDKPHVLVIDEINRGNLAKIFGELFFLLEYRDRPIRLQYSPDEEFRLPDNLFVIGTMNTADRSIALVDSALRRRFYFVPFSPLTPPIDGLLGRWLDREGYSRRPAELLAGLNEALTETPGIGEEFAIGPSYFMTRSGEPNVARVWEYSIMPLLVERLYGAKTEAEIAVEYSIAEIARRADAEVAAPTAADELAVDDHQP